MHIFVKFEVYITNISGVIETNRIKIEHGCQIKNIKDIAKLFMGISTVHACPC